MHSRPRRKSPFYPVQFNRPVLELLEERRLLSFDYALSEAGPIHVARGHNLYVGINATSSSPSQEAESVWMSTQTPAGISVGWETNSYFYLLSSANSGVYPALMRISVSPSAALGAFNVVLTGDSDGTHVIHSINVPIVVEDMPAELPAPQFDISPLPIDPTVLGRWESRMTSYGATYGNPSYILAHPPGDESGSWYYDGERVFYQIADYTGDSSWVTSAEASESVFRPYVLNNNGQIPGYRNFAQGLAMDYQREPVGSQERLNDANAVAALANNCGPYPPGIYDVAVSRETAYALESNLQAKMLGLTIDDAKLQRLVDAALGHLDQWTNMRYIATGDPFIQPFMVGLTSNALIKWYQYTVAQHAQNSGFAIDTRVPGAIRTAADWLIGQTGGQYNAWNPTYNCFNYKIHYSGYNVDTSQITSIEVDPYTSQLNLLIAPLFGWPYHNYGETNGAIYRQWGDTIFAGGTSIGLDTGKQFSQNYRVSGDYVQWRTDNPWALDSTAPVISAYAERPITLTANYITWKTDEATSSVVEYGLTGSYGNTFSNSLLMKNHRQEITGLTQGSTYHYRIRSTDASGNVTHSADRTFVAGANPLTVTITATDRDATENSADTGTFTFTRSSGVGSLTLDYTINGTATNGSDYQAIGTSVTFSDGETTKTLTITPLNDTTPESTEFVTLALVEASGWDVQGTNADTVRIFDDDNPVPTVSVSAPDAWAYENNPADTGTWRISRGSTTGPLTVYYTITCPYDGYANNGTQYQLLPTSVTFAPGESTKDIVLTPINDDFIEGNVGISLTIVESDAADYRIGSPSAAWITMPTNDSAVNVTVADGSASESGDTGAFTINRTWYDGQGTTVYFTLTGTATNGDDYVAIPLSVTFTPGESAKTIIISPIIDAIVDPNETVILTLTAPTGCNYNITWGPGSGTVTMANVNQPTDIALSSTAIVENRPSGTAVGAFSSTDADTGDSFTYSLVGGTGSTDNASFTISGNQLLTAASFDYEAKSSYSIRVRSTDAEGLSFEKTFAINVTDVDEIAPTVTAVYVRGSGWASGYLSFLAGSLAGSSSTYGYAIPTGTGSSQLQTLPWRNLNQISIAFSEDVSIAQAQFAIAGSVGSYSASGFSYSSADHVATWSLSAAIGPDKLYVAVPGTGTMPVNDVAGNVLDGEWNNPTSYSQSGSTSVFPSGNGSAGGDFAFRFDVLPGDSSGGSLGKVNVADVAQTKSRSSLPVSSITYRSDFDGNNLVNVADVAYVKSKSSVYSLPTNPPAIPVFSSPFSQVSLLKAKLRFH